MKHTKKNWNSKDQYITGNNYKPKWIKYVCPFILVINQINAQILVL